MRIMQIKNKKLKIITKFKCLSKINSTTLNLILLL